MFFSNKFLRTVDFRYQYSCYFSLFTKPKETNDSRAGVHCGSDWINYQEVWVGIVQKESCRWILKRLEVRSFYYGSYHHFWYNVICFFFSL